MNAQEIFNTVVTHLFTQGKRGGVVVGQSNDGSERFLCKYRAEDGSKCAIGALIPDEMYHPRMDEESLRVSSLIERAYTLPSYFKDNITLLDDLQYAHDCADSWKSKDDLKKRLRSVAISRGLSAGLLDVLHLPEVMPAQ